MTPSWRISSPSSWVGSARGRRPPPRRNKNKIILVSLIQIVAAQVAYAVQYKQCDGSKSISAQSPGHLGSRNIQLGRAGTIGTVST